MQDKRKKYGKKNQGFTLVEMIVVIVILAVVAAITVPAFTKYIDSSKAKQCVIYRKTLVSRLEEARVTKRDAIMSEIIEKYPDIVCPAGGTYSAKDQDTVQCDLHGETATISSGIGEVSMNTPKNPQQNTGSGSSSGSSSGQTGTEAPETEPSTESVVIPSETEQTGTTETEQEETTKNQESSSGKISSDGTVFEIDGVSLSAGTWDSFRDRVYSFGADWTGIRFAYWGIQRIFSENGKLYIVYGDCWVYKSKIEETTTIEEYNAKVSNSDQQLYEVKTDQIYYYEEMSDEQKGTVAEVGTVLCYDGEYYVAFRNDITFSKILSTTDITDNGWWRIRKDSSAYMTQITIAGNTVNVLDSAKIGEAEATKEAWLDPGNMISYNGEIYMATATQKITGGTLIGNSLDSYVKLAAGDTEILDYETLCDAGQQWSTAAKGTVMLYNGQYYASVSDWAQYGGAAYLNGWVLLQ